MKTAIKSSVKRQLEKWVMNTGCRDESGSGLDELSRDEIHADQIAVGRAAESYVLSDCLLACLLGYFKNPG